MRKTGLPRRAVVLVLLGLVVASASAVTATVLRRPLAPVASTAPHDALATLPISFEPADGGFVSRGPGYSFALSPAGAVVGVGGGRFGLRPAGPLANPAAELVAADPLGATVTRITGNDPSQWRTGVPAYGRVAARQVWPGVDMVWHGDQRRLEHDMVVAPGTDPAVVAFEVDGALGLSVDAAGDLVVALDGSTARLAKPVLYQEVAGTRRPVDGAFNLLGPSGPSSGVEAPSQVGFTVGAYDTGQPLVIDPTLQTSTLLGGTAPDAGYAIAVDTQGNTYVTGTTESGDFLTSEPLQKALSGAAGVPSADVFVSKFSADGAKLIWSTYLGGGGRDTGFAIAAAGDGSVYVSGVTESPDFPVARGAQTAYGGGTSDGFVARIAANGTGIEWSSFLGGGGTDRARGLAIDSTGNAYLTGSTNSDNFPSVNAQQPGPFRAEDLDAFVAKFPANGAPFTFSTRLGGGNDDRGLAIAVDPQGAVYVTGDTLSPGFPTVRPIQASSGGSAGGVAGAFADAFVAKYNPTGNALVYSTFLGGSDFDQGTAIAVDAQGAAYVAGNTNSPNFPTTAPLQAAKSNDPDAFVTKIDAPGAAIVYSTYLGGNGADGANGIAIDRAGAAHVVGTTGSANFVSNKATQLAKGGGDDAFVVKLDSTGRGPLFASFLGGRETDAGMGVALTSQGLVRVLGLTASADFPSVKPVQGAKPPAGGDAFVASFELVDAAAPATTAATTQVAAPGSSAGDDAHDRRVRTFGLIFLGLLLAATAQTFYLRRRTPAPVAGRGGGGRPPSRPAAKAGPTGKVAPARKAAPAGKAAAGVKVIDTPAPEAQTAGATTAGPGPRGGQKATSAQKKAAASRKAAERRARKERAAAEAAAAAAAASATEVRPAPAPAPPEAETEAPPAVPVAAVPAERADEGGPPTMATPPAAPEPPKAKPHVPAIAALLEEDLWAPGESPDAGVEADDTVASPAPAAAARDTQAATEWAPFDTGSVPVVGDDAPPPAAPPQPGVPIPPVPAAELSFWDLFPEDLPPARPAAFPADDVTALPEGPDSAVERLALPEGPDSAAERLATPDASPPPAQPFAEVDPLQVASADQERPSRPPEAEIVIAELLDGPPPTGTRMPAESQWAPAPEEDIFINDLLVAPPDGEDSRNGDGGDDLANDDLANDDLAAAEQQSPSDQARIAADRARRRRSRRGGGRGNQPGSG